MVDALSWKQSSNFRISKGLKNSEVGCLFFVKKLKALIAFFCSTKIWFDKFLDAEN